MYRAKLNPKVTWACFVIAMAIYVTMLVVTLPTLSNMANGLPAFDMRTFGYSVDQANEYLQALSEEGRRYYIDRQLVLDIFYPPLLSLTIFGAAMWGWSHTRLDSKLATPASAVISLAITLFDYAENISVYFMLTAADVPDGLIEAASLMTISKSSFTILAFFGLSCLFATQIVIWLVSQIRQLIASSK